jgi:hypothetical protein
MKPIHIVQKGDKNEYDKRKYPWDKPSGCKQSAGCEDNPGSALGGWNVK